MYVFLGIRYYFHCISITRAQLNMLRDRALVLRAKLFLIGVLVETNYMKHNLLKPGRLNEVNVM